MRIRLSLQLTDRDGNRAQTGIYLPSLASVEDAVAKANALAAVVEGISNARVTSAQAVITVPPSVQTEADAAANIYERLHIFCTNGSTYAQVTIPSPRGGAYDTSGPLRDIRIQEGSHPVSQAIIQLLDALSDAVLADGTPFPTGEWVAGRSLNQ